MSATVCVLVTDLRREPIPLGCGYARDPLQESQLLYGEEVKVLRDSDEWCFVEAIRQPKKCSTNEWMGYPGWVKKEDLIFSGYAFNYVIQNRFEVIFNEPDLNGIEILKLPFGASCFVEKELDGWLQVRLVNGALGYIKKSKQKKLLEKAADFIGFPYLWGGCSPYHSAAASHSVTSVDCSGLTHLLYRSIGQSIPRDAKDQFAVCMPIDSRELIPGDLVFRSDTCDPKKIDHVMIFEKDDHFIEACLEATQVRYIDALTKFGYSTIGLQNGESFKGHTIFFGRVHI